MPYIDSLDYLNLNSLRRYPLREGVPALSTDENFTIPDTLIVDCILATGGLIQERYFISKLFNKLNEIVIEISSDLSGTTAVVGTFVVSPDTHVLYADYYLNETTAYLGANGKITLGDLAELHNQPTGEFLFDLSATELEARVAIPSLKGIPRITFTDDVNGVKSVTGDVVMASRANLRFTYDDTNEFVVLDAGDGLGLNTQCAEDICVKKINGVGPDAKGNINLIGLNCLTVSNTAANTLYFADTCCTPCSGCTDLESLTTRLVSLENNFLSIKDYYNSLNAQLTTYLSTANSNCSCST